MKNHIRFQILAAAAVLVLICQCGPTIPVKFFGTVKDPYGNTVSGAIVQLHYLGQNQTTVSDFQGGYSLLYESPYNGLLYLTAAKEDCLETSKQINTYTIERQGFLKFGTDEEIHLTLKERGLSVQSIATLPDGIIRSVTLKSCYIKDTDISGFSFTLKGYIAGAYTTQTGKLPELTMAYNTERVIEISTLGVTACAKGTFTVYKDNFSNGKRF